MEFTLHFAGDGVPSATYARLPAPPVLTQASIAASPSTLLPRPPSHYTVSFVIPGGDLCAAEPILFTDIPALGAPFQRGKFREIPFQAQLTGRIPGRQLPRTTSSAESTSNDHVAAVAAYGVPSKFLPFADLRCTIPVASSGIFEFFLEYHAGKPLPTNSPPHSCCSHQRVPQPRQTMLAAPLEPPTEEDCCCCRFRIRGPSGYILVEPTIAAPAAAMMSPLDVDVSPTTIRRVPLDGIVVQTVIPKWLPVIEEWDPYLAALQNQHYNYIHFAPLNVRGSSNSPYSLYDQLDFSHDLFRDQTLTKELRQQKLHATLTRAREVFGIYSVTDIVWNHTASNSDWLLDHPDAGYNLSTAPHLTAAYDIDTAIVQFSGKLRSFALDPNVGLNGEAKLNSIFQTFRKLVFPGIKLWEYYVVNVDDHVNKLTTTLLSSVENTDNKDSTKIMLSNCSVIRSIPSKHPELYQRFRALPLHRMPMDGKATMLKSSALPNHNSLRKRFAKVLNMDYVICFFASYKDLDTTSVADIGSELKTLLNIVNVEFYKECDNDTEEIFRNIENTARYIRLDPSGPKWGPISEESPIVGSYFVRLPKNERTAKFSQDQLALAVNGWLWNADPLVNFANPNSKAYLLRQVIEWGDCVKLRFGNSPKDNPELWQRYEEYTRLMARIFDGIRIDNCHSTPINVASYLLDCAREENPDIYIFAELFTGSEEKDYIFCERLGIHSLVREAMNASSAPQIAHDLRNFGSGLPLGTFVMTPEYVPPFIVQGHYNQVIKDDSCNCIAASDFVSTDCSSNSSMSSGRCGNLLSLEHRGSKLHALYVDCTHDNKMPNEIHTAEHTLPTAAIVAFSVSAIGSTLGFDQLLPQHLDLVNLSGNKNKYALSDMTRGIAKAKGVLNKLHLVMARESMCTSNIWEQNGVVFVQRMNPYNGKGYFLAAFTKFNDGCPAYLSDLATVGLNGQRVRHILSAKIKVTGQRHFDNLDKHSGSYFRPLESSLEFYGEDVKESPFFKSRLDNDCTKAAVTVLECQLDQFTAGSIVVFETTPIYDVNSVSGSPHKLAHDHVHRIVDLVPLTPGVEKEPRDVSLLGPLGNIRMLRYMSALSQPSLLYDWGEYLHNSHVHLLENKLLKIVSKFDMLDVNITLYKSVDEERAVFPDIGPYNIPGYGDLAYCGLQGIYSYLKKAVIRNDPIGDRLADALQYQDWVHDYIINRLNRYVELHADHESLREFRDWLSMMLTLVKSIGFPILRQHLFIVCVLHSYFAIRDRGLEILLTADLSSKLFSPVHVQSFKAVILKHKETSSLAKFVRNLQMTNFQLTTSKVCDLIPTRDFPRKLPADGSLAAGLPHFSHGYMRCWGRDVMISLRGLYIMNSQFECSEAHLIAFAATLRHGLIPNLLDSGIKPRYNCRDAAWWFLYMVAEHCRASPDGFEFLKTVVPRRFTPKMRYRGDSTGGEPPSNDSFLKYGFDEADPEKCVDTYCALPSEDQGSPAYKYSNTMAQICYEILERHFVGISFVEYGAGPQIDHAMNPDGFYVQVGVNPTTGFVYGGSQHNCGTWMDKMGDSDKAGNKGRPATPRDGSAVEIVGLSKNVLKFFGKETQETDRGRELFPWKGVAAKKDVLETTRSQRKLQGVVQPPVSDQDVARIVRSAKDLEAGYSTIFTFVEWESAIEVNFHAHFYVPENDENDAQVEAVGYLRKDLVNRRGIYKDTYGATQQYGDYQLRCNVPIAMTVSPEIFKHESARKCLSLIREVLVGPLGVKTLDPSDWAYRGIYDNANDSSDPSIAHGFNYHQGPEWLYPMGFYIRAYLRFFGRDDKGEIISKEELAEVHMYVSRVLLAHKKKIEDSAFAGLPELTNADGLHCGDSCESQAWSNSVMLEVVYDSFRQLAAV